MRDLVFAARLQGVNFPPSHKIMGRVRELRQQGAKVINFGSKGDTPQRAKAAAIKMLESEDAAYYTDSRGTIELRRAIAKKLRLENGIESDPDQNIVVTLGGMEAVLLGILAFVDSGDEVLVDDPGWMNFEPMIRIAGGVPVPVPLLQQDGFHFSIDNLRKRITARSKLLILCNPDNPTGRVLDRSELEAIAQVAREFNLVVVADEAYEDFTFDGRRHISIATLDGMRDRTVTVQTMSKIYNMFGWRIGWLVASGAIVDKIVSIHSRLVGCPTSFAQAGAAAILGSGIAQGDIPITEIVKNYEMQRDAMVDGLNAIPGVSCWKPQGAYFAFPSIKSFGLPSVELASYLLEEARVATTPGSAFGAHGEGHLRVLLNAPVEEIREGVASMARALAKLAR
jgi:aminotransferase